MGLKVTFSNKDFPSDYEFDVRGLGLFVNGKAREVTEEEEAAFEAETGMTLEEAVKDNESFKVESGTKGGEK